MADDLEAVWPESRESVTYREVREVLNGQKQMLSDIDDKAMRTARLTALLIGAILTAWNISGGSVFHRELLIGDGVSLFSSIVTGIVTYSESRGLILGPKGKYVEQLVRNSFHGRSWNEDYLLTTGYWVEENHLIIEKNSRLLSACQALLILGLLFSALAVIF